jgi:hypothetical protein
VLLGKIVDNDFEANGNIVWALRQIGGYVPLPCALPMKTSSESWQIGSNFLCVVELLLPPVLFHAAPLR